MKQETRYNNVLKEDCFIVGTNQKHTFNVRTNNLLFYLFSPPYEMTLGEWKEHLLRILYNFIPSFFLPFLFFIFLFLITAPNGWCSKKKQSGELFSLSLYTLYFLIYDLCMYASIYVQVTCTYVHWKAYQNIRCLRRRDKHKESKPPNDH